jgi:glucose-1-phosphate thymidylyltransferase
VKGIVLAGGRGSRLFPLTLATCKQLLPVYDKPMIYYSLSVLMLAGVREILIISTPVDLPRFQELLGDGSAWGISLTYAEQPAPEGIAQAFLIGKEFIESDPVALILGDNLFYGADLEQFLAPCRTLKEGGIIFGYEVKDPERYGTLAFGPDGSLEAIIEKPKVAPSPYAVTGLYFYDNQVIDIAASLKPSARGELEITDVNNVYLRQGNLKVQLLGRGFAWLDTGTCKTLHDASTYVQTIQERQGIKIGCVEEVAYQMGYIDDEQLARLAAKLKASDYGAYLTRISNSSLKLQPF